MPEPIVEPTPEVSVETTPEAPKPTPGELLYNVAKSCIGKDMRTNKSVPIEYACAESLNTVFKKATGRVIGGGAATAQMIKVLEKDPRFKELAKPEPYAIVISPTEGDKTGHVGQLGLRCIMSNNSLTGKWDCYGDMNWWYKRYQDLLGLDVRFFRYIGG